MRFPTINDSTYKWWAFVALALGVFVSVADAGSVVVALPTISQDFGTDLPTIQWVVTAYALTISALLLPMGRLSDIVGRKLLYVAGTGRGGDRPYETSQSISVVEGQSIHWSQTTGRRR